MKNIYGVREDTWQAVMAGVGTLENYFLDNTNAEPMTINDALDYAYSYYEEEIQHTAGMTTAARFTKKEKVIDVLKKEIQSNKEIKLI